jgi:hypothetical protein
MNNHQMIIEQIRRMRSKRYEPERIIVDSNIYIELGLRNHIMGVPLECDKAMKGFEVR